MIRIIITVEEDYGAEEFINEVRGLIDNYFGDSAFFEVSAAQ